MEHVCKDSNGPSNWYFDPEKSSYQRIFNDGKITKLYGKFLPDPYTLWQQRQDKMRTDNPDADLSNIADSTRPQEATFKLWEHWQCQV